jgi:hypothetical protein
MDHLLPTRNYGGADVNARDTPSQPSSPSVLRRTNTSASIIISHWDYSIQLIHLIATRLHKPAQIQPNSFGANPFQIESYGIFAGNRTQELPPSPNPHIQDFITDSWTHNFTPLLACVIFQNPEVL